MVIPRSRNFTANLDLKVNLPRTAQENIRFYEQIGKRAVGCIEVCTTSRSRDRQRLEKKYGIRRVVSVFIHSE